MTTPRLLKARDAAALVGISAIRLYALAREHKLPEGVAVRIGTRAVRFSSVALERWLSGPVAVAQPTPAAPVTPVSRRVVCPECGCDIVWAPR